MPIILFDGVCNLCNRTVDFIIRRDSRRTFRFSALQSDYATTFLKKRKINVREDPDSVLLYEDGMLYSRSEAVFRILQKLPFPWSLMGKIGMMIPWFISDFFYNLIARVRYRFWGRRQTCRVPTEEERSLFLL